MVAPSARAARGAAEARDITTKIAAANGDDRFGVGHKLRTVLDRRPKCIAASSDAERTKSVRWLATGCRLPGLPLARNRCDVAERVAGSKSFVPT
jgi:hypothetical protein